MATRARQEKLSQELAGAGRRASERGRFLPRLYLLGCLLLTMVVCLPLSWGIFPLPYHLGYIAPVDILSRARFFWRDLTEEERRIGEIRSEHANRYVQVPEAEWINRVSGPLWRLMDRGMRARSVEDMLAYAAREKIELTPSQAAAFLRELKDKKEWLKPFAHIVAPMQDVLTSRVYRRGLMSRKRWLAERNRDIHVVTPLGESRRLSVAGPRTGPLIPSQLKAVLDEGFSNDLGRLSLDFRASLRDVLLKRMVPTLVFDEAGSRAQLAKRIAYVRSQIQEVHVGDLLLAHGQQVTPGLLRKLRAEQRQWLNQIGWPTLARRLAGKAALLLLLLLGGAAWLCLVAPPGPGRDVDAILLAGIVLLTSLPAYALIAWGLPATMLPLGLLAGVLSLLRGRGPAILAVTVAALLLLVIFEGRPGVIVSYLAGGWLFACLAPEIRHRLTLLTTVVACGLLAAALIMLWRVGLGEEWLPGMVVTDTRAWWQAGLAPLFILPPVNAFLTWFVSGLLLLLVLPPAERVFQATTNMTLQEHNEREHPCLRQLVLEAPGTYHHSVIVGTLAEAGARAIGANPLLARAGSMYHDIGKLMKPEYFTENEAGVSRHDSLNPAMSTLIIIAHVKDGAEMARAYRLPRAVIDIIEQHHGRSHVSFFLDRARKQAAAGERVAEESFRYPGPVPQSPEAALVMLADSVEAASRSLDTPSPGRIRKLVHEIIIGRLLDHQLDASGLTLTALSRVEDAFWRVLTSMYHTRVKYPDSEERRN